jgi:CheY-like chemotaxis protein
MPVEVSGARVLVVDDNAVNRSILMEQMSSWGFDSCAAESGDEGLKVLRAAHGHGIEVDCLVLDYQMPGMSGADMARRLRASDDICDIPIVLLTSVDQSLSSGMNRELAIDAQLTKPARASALLEAVVETIQKNREKPVSKRFGAGDEGMGAAPAPREGAVTEGDAALAPATYQRPQNRFAVKGPDRHRVDILVAEDNEVNQLVFTQILSETGLTFEIVGNGALAVEACRNMKPRMILMDVSMPEMNGLEATARIREMERGSGDHTPVIGVTAHALKGDRERCLEAGMDDYLSKPISPKALLDKVERWVHDGDTRRQTA